jgi:excisionase family DNA binding protein
MPDDAAKFNPSTEIKGQSSALLTAPTSEKVRGRKASTAQVEPAGLCPVSPIAVTIKQAAKLVGTNDKQIRRAIYAREIQVVRLGKSYSIAVADIQRWFDRKKTFI